MRFRLPSYGTLLLAALGMPGAAQAQIPGSAMTVTPAADGYATEAGVFLLAIPGVADDFVLFADGLWQLRADGTARYSAYLQSQSAVDRDLFLVLDFAGRIDPGAGNPPPPGSPVTTLTAQAYVPNGPVDPTTFGYYTQVTGTMTGLRAFDGARIAVVNTNNAQFGAGANNLNVQQGMLVDLDLSIVQPPTSAAFAPTGPARLRADFAGAVDLCATHVDADAGASGASDRVAFDLPGVASDYLFLRAGTFHETGSGDAMLTGSLKRQSDYDDSWQLQLAFRGRVDPGDPAHPPAGHPVQLLLPGIYAAQGGPIDPGEWRYYTQVSGMLIGNGINAGGSVQVAATGAFQVGLGADQGNVFFGLSGELTASVVQQAPSRPLTITGDARLRANLATSCILPAPHVLTGDAQSVETVTQQQLTYTGTDLGFVEQAAIGPFIVGGDDRRWLSGHVHVVDHQTVELSIPQGLPAAVYDLTFLNPTRGSNLLSVDLQEPAGITLRTENDRLIGEAQHWVTHQGNVQGFAFCFVVISDSDLPSLWPGFVDLQIGNQFSNYILVDVAIQNALTHTSVVTLAQIPAALTGLRLYAQAALMDQTFFPLQPSDVWFTDY